MIPRQSLHDSPCPRKPRASGDDPSGSVSSQERTSVNPARAGMIPLTLTLLSVWVCKPRASGDDPAFLAVKAVADL